MDFSSYRKKLDTLYQEIRDTKKEMALKLSEIQDPEEVIRICKNFKITEGQHEDYSDLKGVLIASNKLEDYEYIDIDDIWYVLTEEYSEEVAEHYIQDVVERFAKNKTYRCRTI